MSRRDGFGIGNDFAPAPNYLLRAARRRRSKEGWKHTKNRPVTPTAAPRPELRSRAGRIRQLDGVVLHWTAGRALG